MSCDAEFAWESESRAHRDLTASDLRLERPARNNEGGGILWHAASTPVVRLMWQEERKAQQVHSANSLPPHAPAAASAVRVAQNCGLKSPAPNPGLQGLHSGSKQQSLRLCSSTARETENPFAVRALVTSETRPRNNIEQSGTRDTKRYAEALCPSPPTSPGPVLSSLLYCDLPISIKDQTQRVCRSFSSICQPSSPLFLTQASMGRRTCDRDGIWRAKQPQTHLQIIEDQRDLALFRIQKMKGELAAKQDVICMKEREMRALVNLSTERAGHASDKKADRAVAVSQCDRLFMDCSGRTCKQLGCLFAVA